MLLLFYEISNILNGIYIIVAANYFSVLMFQTEWYWIAIDSITNAVNTLTIVWLLWNFAYMYWVSAMQLSAITIELDLNDP
jgi:hypothetical protein